MADGVTVDLKGFPELIKRWEEDKKKVLRSMKAAVQAGADVLIRGQRRFVRVHSGKLQRSITSRVKTNKQGFIKLRIGPGPSGRYGGPLEVGHVMSGKFAHLAPRKVEPRPFAGPAFEADWQQADETVRGFLLRVIEG